MLAHLYRVRLRSHGVQELLAGSGIAVGVALVLGVLVANASITGAAEELVHQLVGSARLQLEARSPDGFDEQLLYKSRTLEGVRVAAPILRENVAVLGPRGRQAVQLLGVTPTVAALGGFATQRLGVGQNFRFTGGLLLPASVARAIGAHTDQRGTILAFGRAHTITVGGVLQSAPFGALASAPIAVTPLASAQKLTGLRELITQILPERRRFVANLRMQGYDWRQVIVLLGFQAVVLGALASVAGVLLGDILSRAFLHRIPPYL